MRNKVETNYAGILWQIKNEWKDFFNIFALSHTKTTFYTVIKNFFLS